MATRFDPFREMDRILNDALRTPATAPMPMDLYRQGEEFVVKIDLPGVDPSTIDIDVDDRTMTIRAERHDAPEDVQWLSHERPTGTFARQLTLGQGVALDRIEADYSDGVITLTIPMAEEAKPRKINVAHSERSTAVGSGSGTSTDENRTIEGDVQA